MTNTAASAEIEWAEKTLGIRLLPWQRDVLERHLKGEQVHVVRGRSAGWSTVRYAGREVYRLRRVENAIADLKKHFGIIGYLGPAAHHIVIRDSDYAWLVHWATLNQRPDSTQLEDSIAGVPIVTAPDWTCDSSALAYLRLRAVVSRPFVRFLRWVFAS